MADSDALVGQTVSHYRIIGDAIGGTPRLHRNEYRNFPDCYYAAHVNADALERSSGVFDSVKFRFHPMFFPAAQFLSGEKLSGVAEVIRSTLSECRLVNFPRTHLCPASPSGDLPKYLPKYCRQTPLLLESDSCEMNIWCFRPFRPIIAFLKISSTE